MNRELLQNYTSGELLTATSIVLPELFKNKQRYTNLLYEQLRCYGLIPSRIREADLIAEEAMCKLKLTAQTPASLKAVVMHRYSGNKNRLIVMNIGLPGVFERIVLTSIRSACPQPVLPLGIDELLQIAPSTAVTDYLRVADMIYYGNHALRLALPKISAASANRWASAKEHGRPHVVVYPHSNFTQAFSSTLGNHEMKALMLLSAIAPEWARARGIMPAEIPKLPALVASGARDAIRKLLIMGKNYKTEQVKPVWLDTVELLYDRPRIDKYAQDYTTAWGKSLP